MPPFTIYEHESLYTNRGDQRLSIDQLKALQLFYGTNGVPYYTLINNGVKFKEFVGVLQLGTMCIEVLPKADNVNLNEGDENQNWRSVLFKMLQAVGAFNIHAPSFSNLNIRSNSILDLYFELFIKEVEYLLHRGLVKKYRKTEGNRNALKGRILFSKHISKNLVHQERFYVKYNTYDKEHDLHAILFKALKLLSNINNKVHLNSRLGAILLNFPELYEIKITDRLFDRLVYNRKTEAYRNAIEIAKLILLNYHPDINRGTNNVLALMFNMNLLWEKFVYVSLRKRFNNITDKDTKNFWEPTNGKISTIEPDIVINNGEDNCIVLDTKWKNLRGKNPSPSDLRQMYVYKKYYGAQKVALVYPDSDFGIRFGQYYQENPNDQNNEENDECSMISIGVNPNVNDWQDNISTYIGAWANLNNVD